MDKKISIPPTPIKSIRKQKDESKSDVLFYTTIHKNDIVDVYEVWEVTFDGDQDSTFIVISAKCSLAGYKKADWSQVQYRGFYASEEEAINNIYGYLY